MIIIIDNKISILFIIPYLLHIMILCISKKQYMLFNNIETLTTHKTFIISFVIEWLFFSLVESFLCVESEQYFSNYNEYYSTL